ncbi:Domain of uncharacterised function (DUF3448) [Serratia fonticola]|uniref:SGNH/GDSL hydrolase family protein n=1 Tax=Serratia fonticola TaxID=47917 RepID=UPI00218392FA|nr:SGNH/GDSL hydrolase family protein [Serratia fonticola]CAI2121063.1 Domain of uncharacterised function (DUF3448) [Serratia fonticola]
MKITENPAWIDEINMISRGEKVSGGRDGAVNIQAKQLADRTALLKLRIDSIDDAKDRTFHITVADPDGTIEGMKNTPPGEVFRVAQGVDSEYAFIYYASVEGVALPVGRYMSDNYVKNRLLDVMSTPQKVPLAVDDEGNVPAWFEGGKLNAVELHEDINPVSMLKAAPNKVPLVVDDEGNVPAWFEDGKLNAVELHEDINPVSTLESSPNMVPLIVDNEGNVPAWFEDGKLNAVGLHDNLKDIILSWLNNDNESQKDHSQGETLWQWRAKKARKDAGLASCLKIGFTGDSWTEHKTIPQVFSDYFYGRYGKASDGWIQLNIDNVNLINGITLSRSGWSVYDASTTAAAPPFPTSMDGQYIFTSDTGATLLLGNLFASSVRIFYYDGNGEFRYSTNGGEPTVVSCSGTNKIVSVEIKSLTISKASSISIDLTGNKGTVVIYGFYADGTGNGVEISKMGNGGITAPGYTKTLTYLPQTASVVAPDVLVMIIGTNDFRTNVTLDSFKAGLTSWIQAWQAIIPDSAIILVAPPQCNASGKNDLSKFRDIMDDVAKSLKVEFYSMFDHMNTSWAKSNAQGMWVDSLHLSNGGARFLLNQLNSYFLES